MYKLVLAVGFFLGLLGSTTHAALAQSSRQWGSWFIGTVQLSGTDEHRWGGFAEGQIRTNALFREYLYHELKGGVSLDLGKNFTALLGGGRYITVDPENRSAGPLVREARLWQQVVLTQYPNRLKLEHRYRVEQRWFRFRDDSTAFGQRLRYRLNAFLPLNRTIIGPRTVFLSVYDEIFLNPKGPFLERNRFYFGAGYQLNAHFTLQVGWLNQANYSRATVRQGQFVPQGTAAKPNVVLAVAYRLRRRTDTAAPERLPSQQD
jgi:hypothetical protein